MSQTPQAMTKSGGARKTLDGWSGLSFSARNQIPGGTRPVSMSQGRMEAASPKRRPRDSAIMERARRVVSARVVVVSDTRYFGWNQVRTGNDRRRSAAGDSFHQIGTTWTVVQPMSQASLMAERVVRTVEPAQPFATSVARYRSTKTLSVTWQPTDSRKVDRHWSLER